MMNPFDWILMLNKLIQAKDAKTYEPIIAHLKRMIKCYILQVSKMDVEITTALKLKPSFVGDKQPSNVNQLKYGIINNKDWSVIFKTREGGKPDGKFIKTLFRLHEKHLYTTEALDLIYGIVDAQTKNSANDKKYFKDMICWYIAVLNNLLNVMPLVFKTTTSAIVK